MQNCDIRAMAKEAGVTFWQIADVLGVSEPTMTRMMRRPLNDTNRLRIVDAIHRVETERGANHG